PGFAPVPRHVSHSSSFGIEIVVSFPKIASSNSRTTVYCKSAPCRGAFGSRLAPPPKNISNISSKPPKPLPQRPSPPNLDPWQPPYPIYRSCHGFGQRTKFP